MGCGSVEGTRRPRFHTDTSRLHGHACVVVRSSKRKKKSTKPSLVLPCNQCLFTGSKTPGGAGTHTRQTPGGVVAPTEGVASLPPHAHHLAHRTAVARTARKQADTLQHFPLQLPRPHGCGRYRVCHIHEATHPRLRLAASPGCKCIGNIGQVHRRDAVTGCGTGCVQQQSMSVWVVVPLRCLYACLKLHVEMFAVYAQKAVYRIENTPFLSRSP